MCPTYPKLDIPVFVNFYSTSCYIRNRRRTSSRAIDVSSPDLYAMCAVSDFNICYWSSEKKRLIIYEISRVACRLRMIVSYAVPMAGRGHHDRVVGFWPFRGAKFVVAFYWTSWPAYVSMRMSAFRKLESRACSIFPAIRISLEFVRRAIFAPEKAETM